MKKALAMSIFCALAVSCISCDKKDSDKKRKYTTTKAPTQKVEKSKR